MIPSVPGIGSQMFPCPRCKKLLAPPTQTGPQRLNCVQCGDIEAVVFPRALEPQPQAERAERIIDDQDASCFYHVESKARAACESCGRFLCALCEVQMGDAVICPGCIAAGRRKGNLDKSKSEELLWDQLVLALAAACLLIFYLAPLMLIPIVWIVIRQWNAPRRSLMPRSRASYYAALGVSLVMSGLMILAMTAMWSALNE